jgi:hypothetical protein
VAFERIRVPQLDGGIWLPGGMQPIVGYDEVWIERLWQSDFVRDDWYARKGAEGKILLYRQVQPNYGGKP